LPIGRPIPGWNFLLLQEEDGVRLIIASENSANRYAGTTTKHFFNIELLNREIPAFDTGDYFIQKDSELFFSHRLDGMIKINGNRVDLGDIESGCKKLGLQNPVALFIDEKIVVWAEGKSKNKDKIRHKLFEILPPYSVPSSINFHEFHPRTSNGKIDRHHFFNILT
jgi:acyl-CoA synthetase (AMP-forming)/AMP-acid ligase II